MWRSLFNDMFESLQTNASDVSEATILGIHLFNISKGLQCSGLQEDDPESNEILPQNWKSNSQLYSFRYTNKSIQIYVKLLKVSANKINIHAARSDKNDKILHFSIDLAQLPSDSSASNFTESLIQSVLVQYEKEILSVLIVQSSSEGTKPEEKAIKVQPKRSILEDDSVPYGMPYAGGFFNSNPYSNPLRMPGNLVGPNHPIFGNPQPGRGMRYDPPAPFYLPNPDHFPPPGPNGFPGSGFHGFPPGYL